jgi:aspartyl aminopeptidase
VNDPRNVSYLGRGVSLEKYGGGGGKYECNDARAEYMQKMRKLLNDNSIPWQTGELGRIDIGGGGTIAKFMSKFGMDCADAGPCVLGMHSPCEVTSKSDIHAAYRLYRTFFGS